MTSTSRREAPSPKQHMQTTNQCQGEQGCAAAVLHCESNKAVPVCSSCNSHRGDEEHIEGHVGSAQGVELAEVLPEPLSIIHQQCWLPGEVPVDWKLANKMPICKKGWKKDLRSYRPVSLTLGDGEGLKQIMSASTWHIRDNKADRPSQKGRPSLTNLISSCGRVTCSVIKGKAVDVFSLILSKAFDAVCASIPLENCLLVG
ncbi:RNA-directed DNA polymerase from mobile element jockey-like protein [Willisornis vidua]|uniref:RNA-directed DNA polymerase from mobile element jockey-like protein n=1 Tax=Willisornis vidua TaxID=1566151 RepID=A0ABQ9DP72_9PASS|nr:RNA-directed DNA polymerase from mobile element jockey-like protein [Willisornis vidua]